MIALSVPPIPHSFAVVGEGPGLIRQDNHGNVVEVIPPGRLPMWDFLWRLRHLDKRPRQKGRFS